MRRRAWILLAVQLLLVLSVAGKYLYERKACPRVWTRAAQVDPSQPLRGRYLALQLLVDGCFLPRDSAHYTPGYQIPGGTIAPGSWNWAVSLEAVKGCLVPRLQDHPRTSRGMQQLTLQEGRPCDRAPVRSAGEALGEPYFIPDRAKGPFPLQPGQELWVEVTLPPSGPPRPIQLALSSAAGFQPLSFE